MKIPIIDLHYSKLEDTVGENEIDEEEEHRIAEELHRAFSTVGFAYLKNHGIDQELIKKAFEVSAELFNLPVDVKCKIKRTPVDNGYLATGREILETGNLRAQEIRESFDILDPRGPFPDDDVPQMKPVITRIFGEFSELSIRLMKALALSLGVSRDAFTDLHQKIGQGVGKNPTGLRSLYYPPLDDTALEEGIARCGEHSDWGTLTLLVQDDMGGLEILSEGKWIPADPIPGTVLMNLGDMMPVWTSKKYRATIHRVRTPEDAKRRRSPRQSIAFFVHPDNEVMVSPIDGSAAEQPPVNALQYLHDQYSRVYKY